MGKCCGAQRSGKRAKRSRERQQNLRDLDEIERTLDEVLVETRLPERSPPRVERERSLRVEPLEVQARPTVIEKFPKWKRERQVLVSDDHMDMSFDQNSSGIGKVDYFRGKIPGVTEDKSARGEDFQNFSEPDKAMVGIAQEVIERVRSSLPKGAFNNYGGLPESVLKAQRLPGTKEQAPAWWNSVVDVAAGIAAEQLAHKYPDVNAYKLQMACLARATKEVGGGVCSKMAMATTGELTTLLPPGSEIVQLFCGYDHEFVIARTPGSRWFVVDPWCHTPTVIPFVDCTFEPDSVEKFIPIVLKETAPKGQPYGLDLDSGMNWKAIIQEATKSTPVTQLKMGKEFGQTDNVDAPNQFDDALGTVPQDKWG